MNPEQAGNLPSGRPRSRIMRPLLWVQLVLVVAIVGGAWVALRGSIGEPESAAPSHIGDMKRISVLTGAAAMQQVQQMHQGDIEVIDGYVANYQAGSEKMTLWVGLAASESDAGRLLEAMVGAIGEGGTPFSRPSAVNIADLSMYFTLGAGGKNYFFQQGHSVVWALLVNSGMPEQRVSDLLETMGIR